MRLLLVALGVGLLLCGCGKSAAEKPTAAYAPPPVLHKWAMTENSPAPAVDNPKEVARHFAKDLSHDDLPVRREASRQLRELGDVGYPHLLAALKEKNSKTRLAALEGLSPNLVQQHQKELVPLMLDAIKDKDAPVRKQVCVCLTWVDRTLVGDVIQAGVMVRERMTALSGVVDRDESREVQDVARESLVSVRDAYKGRVSVSEEPASDPGNGVRLSPKRELRP